tara:strand:- start:1056 stop:1604 length:549 start_codon:yes stop_codon:yes gene_type:complete
MNFKKYVLLVGLLVISSNSIAAGANKIKYVPNYKIGTGIATFSNDIEYERNIIPFTTGYVRYGSASFDIPGASSVNASITNLGYGVRYNLIFVYVGTGFESSQITLKDSTTNGQASGTIAGPIFEVGKTFGIGPISAGAAAGIQLATNKLSYDNNASFTVGDLNFNSSETLFKFEFYASLAF